jgi:hypothetical protein
MVLPPGVANGGGEEVGEDFANANLIDVGDRFGRAGLFGPPRR